jgi:uncharacterized radical SAM superfamily Fe-S cluster-containing enzyme
VSDALLHETTSLCRVCRNGVPARVVARDGQVFMHKTCAVHGPQSVRLSASAEWYVRTRAIAPVEAPPPRLSRPVEHGCPFDCGACPSHAQKIRMPIVTLTSACNLDCPICYVRNKNEGAFHMDRAAFERILAHLKADHGDALDLINLTGGEPTQHPDFLWFLERARAAGIRRVSFCTNGLRLARDEAFVERIAALGGRVALSFDSFESEADFALQGAHLLDVKHRALALLEKHRVHTTLIPVMTLGVNDHEIGRIIDLGLRAPNIRHLEVHTITYTGQGGTTFDPARAGRIDLFTVLERIEAQTQGLLTVDDWVPSPCAHPLCYQIAYLLMDPEGGPPVPFTRFMPRETLYACLSDRLYLEPSPRLDAALTTAIDHLWSAPPEEIDSALAERVMRILRGLLAELFPEGRRLTPEDALAVSERATKAIYVHSHMDEETFDTERVRQCCDADVYADGSSIPVCAHSVLYRDKEAEFMVTPNAWGERSGGAKP